MAVPHMSVSRVTEFSLMGPQQVKKEHFFMCCMKMEIQFSFPAEFRTTFLTKMYIYSTSTACPL